MKVVCLISGGIDSPVAAYLMLKKGWELVFVHMDSGQEGGKQRVVEVVESLRKKFPKAGKLYIVPHLGNLEAFAGRPEKKYTCVFCKRMMLRVAEKVAEREGAEAILNGDNLAQVASQTLQNLSVVSRATKLPIVRPLIGFDKEEIIGIAKDIGTFGPSTQSAMCCSFVPGQPSTAARIGLIEGEEEKLDIENLAEACVSGAEISGAEVLYS